MKLLKKSPLDIAATFLIPPTTHNNYILFTYFHCIKGITHRLLKEATISIFSKWPLLSTQSRQPLPMKFGCNGDFLKYLQKCTRNKIVRCNTKIISNQVQLIDRFRPKQQANITSKTKKDRHWTPLIKVNAADHPPKKNIQLNRYPIKNIFAGKFILCVGGRAALYPEYRRLIASLGANLMIFRGGLESNKNRLYTLLENADMIICPVDCVNHNDFYAVKFYCKFSGKPHTLLDRSNLATFNKGVNTLAKLACQHKCLQNGHNQAASFYQN